MAREAQVESEWEEEGLINRPSVCEGMRSSIGDVMGGIVTICFATIVRAG